MKTSHKLGRVLGWAAGVLAIDLALVLAWQGPVANLAASRDPGGGALVVLWGDRNSFGVEGERRARHVADLWHSGNADRKVFCIGGARPRRDFLGAKILCERLEDLGIPRDRLVVGAGSNDTTSNLAEAIRMGLSEKSARLVVATAPMQTFRARFLIVQGRPDPPLAWAPYSYATVYPKVGLLERYLLAHGELVAAGSLVLPEAWRRSILGLLRG